MTKKVHLTLACIFLLGLAVRLIYFKEITFGWDQARDAFQAIDIWKGDFVKIIGPSTAELPGLHHGSLYWYFLSPFYFFSDGSVYVARLFSILFNLIGVYVAYYFSMQLFKSRSAALLSSFLFAISFEAVQYGRWLSNPSPAIITIPLTFMGLWYLLNGKKKGIPLAVISWALSVHFQFFLVYQAAFIVPVLLWYYKKHGIRVSKEDVIGYVGGFLILVPFLIAEVKFQFQGLKAFSQLGSEKAFFRSFVDMLLQFFDRLVYNFYLNVFGGNLFVAGLLTTLLLVVTAIYIRNKKNDKELLFLSAWLLSPMIVVLFEKAYAYFITIGNLFPMIMLSAYFLTKLSDRIRSKRMYFAILIVVLASGQLMLTIKHNKGGESLFSVQKDMTLSDELRVLDYVYESSDNRPFVVNTVTNPLFINTTWSYLFDWYGMQKYGYMPSWAGYPQDGQFGSEIVYAPIDDREGVDFYLIIEPQPGIPEHVVFGISKFEDTRSELVEEKSFGGFKVQKRVMINNNSFDSDSVYKIIKKHLQ